MNCTVNYRSRGELQGVGVNYRSRGKLQEESGLITGGVRVNCTVNYRRSQGELQEESG